MRKRLLFRNTGFTLVECVIAIAVFAILTVMTLMIMATTVKTQKKSTKAEEDLNTLVQNVVEDESNKKYGADTKTLMMKVGSSGKDFSMTYSTIDGYKNFVTCPNCHEMYNNLDFMGDAYSTAQYAADMTDPVKKTNKASFWFDPNTMNYCCPNCGFRFRNTLECLSCNASGPMNAFTFDHFTGNYYCPDCGSGNVREQGLDVRATGDSDFAIGAMSPNAIRYGDISENMPEEDDVKKFMKISGAADESFRVTLTYTPNANIALPGRYRLRVDNLHVVAGESARFSMTLPPCYICNITSKDTNIQGLSDTQGSVLLSQSADPANAADTGRLLVTNLNSTFSSFELQFTLTNYENNNSFDYDYSDGLMKFWFGNTSNTVNYPKT